ncbi:alanine racemase [Vicingus serpentipes]|uniref:Alanine racemase n=2 Tax=Vicingus serpentipes TaxID=1926625 RepID=A0A5C6RQK3_9FLAO|nr:alanine racemase [Vicingus serpentipes]
MRNLESNLNYFKSLLQPSTKIMVMVKAYSYGMGTFEIANLLEKNNVDYLGVANTFEGAELRNVGIGLPIMVMNPEVESFDLVIKHQLNPVIFSLKSLNVFLKYIETNQHLLPIKPYPINIKIETGMNRLGFNIRDLEKVAEEIKSHPLVFVESVFSHLSAADESQFDDFTNQQIQLFHQSAKKFCSTFDYPILKHLLNSHGIVRFNNAQFDMVRLGIGIYGFSSDKETQQNLLPVSTLTSKISQFKTIPKGDTVGYGRAGKATKELSIATIPLGYADGLNRRLSNGNWSMMVNGKKAPIIGNICMDMLMLDVTGIECKAGDNVVVFGKDNTIVEMAEKLETIPYEILTTISPRVNRIFSYN